MVSNTKKFILLQSIAYMALVKSENNQSFNKQLNMTNIDKNKLHNIFVINRLYTIHKDIRLHIIFNDNTKDNTNKNTPHDPQSNYSQQALKDNCNYLVLG